MFEIILCLKFYYISSVIYLKYYNYLKKVLGPRLEAPDSQDQPLFTSVLSSINAAYSVLVSILSLLRTMLRIYIRIRSLQIRT